MTVRPDPAQSGPVHADRAVLLSRRTLLRRTGLLAGGVSATAILAACAPVGAPSWTLPANPLASGGGAPDQSAAATTTPEPAASPSPPAMAVISPSPAA